MGPVVGARMVEAQKRVGETAQAIELRQSGESSILATIATSLSASLTQVLRWVYWWNSTESLERIKLCGTWRRSGWSNPGGFHAR